MDIGTPTRPSTTVIAPQHRGVSLRAIILGAALVPINVYWVIFSELRWYVVLTLNPLFVTPIFYLAVLALLNTFLRRHAPRWVLNGPELVTIYVMLVMSCTIATHDFIINLMSLIGWPAYNANAQNGWTTRIFPLLPKWLYVWDRDLVVGAFTGNGNLYRWDVLRMWAAPLAFWSVFILAIGFMMLCLNAIVRRAWIEHTRLSFPIVRLPVVLTEDPHDGATIRSRILWAGFALAVAVDLVNGLHDWYPSLPAIPTRAQWVVFTDPAMAKTAPLCLTYYPFAIGLAFLVPLDVSFSCWFFYLFLKAQAVIGYRLGYGDVPDFPYMSEQMIGAWLTFAIYLLWTMRGYLRAFAASAWRGEAAGPNEVLSPRVAVFGLLASCATFAVFWRCAGMATGWVLVVLACYLLLSLAITRVRAEAGGQHTVWDLEPMRLFRMFDSRSLGQTNIATAALSHWYWRLNRCHPMPSQLEAFRLAQEHHMRPRALVLPIMVALAISTVVGMWACLHIFYTYGALARCQGFANWTVTESYGFLENGIGPGFRAEPGRWGALAGAVAGMGALAWLRTRFTWFPLHPLGYCIGPGLIWLWCPFLIAWALKLVILQYGGLRLYRRALPFFLGLVLGDYVAGALWSLIGVIWNVPTYQLFH